MKMKSQKGLTTVGWLVVIAICGMIALTVFRIIPMYLEFYQVRSVMDSVVTDTSIDSKSKKDLWEAISKRLYINNVRDMKKENFKFSRKDGKTTIQADYKTRKPYVAQLFIGAHFTYSVEIAR